VDLSRCFSNPSKPLRTLISRVLKGSAPRTSRSRRMRTADSRGPARENSRQSQTRLSASNRAELVAAYASGAPVNELVARFGVHRSTVWQAAFRAGLVTRCPELAGDVLTEAARLYESGLTLGQVAARLEISRDGARSAIIVAGGTIRPRGRRRVEAWSSPADCSAFYRRPRHQGLESHALVDAEEAVGLDAFAVGRSVHGVRTWLLCV
jgi:hypothetical protein